MALFCMHPWDVDLLQCDVMRTVTLYTYSFSHSESAHMSVVLSDMTGHSPHEGTSLVWVTTVKNRATPATPVAGEGTRMDLGDIGKVCPGCIWLRLGTIVGLLLTR